MRGALGIDPDDVPAREGIPARRARVGVLVHLVGIVLLPVHRYGSAGAEKPRHDGIAEERSGGEVMDLAREHGADEQRIDQVVGMVHAQEHGAARGDLLPAPDVHLLEEEPDPEAADETDDRVEPIGGLSGHRLAHQGKVTCRNAERRASTIGPARRTEHLPATPPV